MIVPGRASRFAVAGAIIRWGMAVGLLVQMSAFAVRETRLLTASPFNPGWWYLSITVALFWWAGLIWAVLASHRLLSRAGVPSHARAFLVAIWVAVALLLYAGDTILTLHFARPRLSHRRVIPVIEAERLVSWFGCPAGVALAIALIAARRRLRGILRGLSGL